MEAQLLQIFAVLVIILGMLKYFLIPGVTRIVLGLIQEHRKEKGEEDD